MIISRRGYCLKSVQFTKNSINRPDDFAARPETPAIEKKALIFDYLFRLKIYGSWGKNRSSEIPPLTFGFHRFQKASIPVE